MCASLSWRIQITFGQGEPLPGSSASLPNILLTDNQDQCDQIGQFLMLLVTTYLSKVDQMFGDLSNNWHRHFLGNF